VLWTRHLEDSLLSRASLTTAEPNASASASVPGKDDEVPYLSLGTRTEHT